MSSHKNANSGPSWAKKLRSFNNWMLFDMGGGPRPFKLATIINLQKGGSFPFMAALIWYYSNKNNNSPSIESLIYLAMHGTYGLTWLMKDILFPDPNWQGRATFTSCVFGILGLGLYWIAGWIVISGISETSYPVDTSIWYMICISICIFGCVVMIAADVQKYTTLQLKKGLITTGMFKWIRHPNYLGEMMIYGSLAMMAWHWAPALVLIYYWFFMFSTNMIMKEESMSRYPEWASYKKRTWWLVPFII